MMFFFDDVATFSSMAESCKGRHLQELALHLDRVMVEGDADAVEKIAGTLQAHASAADRMLKHGDPTVIDHIFDDAMGHGMIEAYPDKETRRPYFRIYYRVVAKRITLQEAGILIAKGGEE